MAWAGSTGLHSSGSLPENRGQGNTEMQRRDLSVTRIISESEHSMRKKKKRPIWYFFLKGTKLHENLRNKTGKPKSKKQNRKAPRSPAVLQKQSLCFRFPSFFHRGPSWYLNVKLRVNFSKLGSSSENCSFFLPVFFYVFL